MKPRIIRFFRHLLSGLVSMLILAACNTGLGSDKTKNATTKKVSANQNNATQQNWRFSYNSMNLLQEIIDPNANITHLSYNQHGQITAITNALNQTTEFADYTENGHPQMIIDPNGVVTKNTYGKEGQLISSITAGAETKFLFDKNGNLLKITYPDGSYHQYEYNMARRLVDIYNGSGGVEFEHDLNGNITQMETYGASGINYQEWFKYDPLNRLTMNGGDASKLSTYKYDNNNNLVDYWNSESGQKFFAYDNLNRVTAITSGNRKTQIGYNDINNLELPSGITDARGNKTSYRYNGLANLLQLVSPDSGTHNYSSFDANGNLLVQVNARGEQISYSYDQLNRPTEINYSANPELDTKFSYDIGSNAIGHLSHIANGVGSDSYSFDARGNIIDETQHIDGVNYSLQYGYNKANKLTSMVYPSSTQVSYQYIAGQLSQIKVNGKIVATITHLPFGPIDKIKFGNGVEEKLSYNTNYEQTGLYLSNGLLNRDYSVMRHQITKISGIGQYYYENDSILNLSMSTDYKYMQFYYSDSLGNLEDYTEFGGTRKIEYYIDPKSNRLLSQTTLNENNEPIIVSNYRYDNAGNIIQVGNKHYIFDEINQLKEVTIDGDNNNSAHAEYSYNALSQRILKKINDSTTIFIYNKFGLLLEEHNLKTNIIRDYIYADGTLIAIVENGTISYIVTDSRNAPILVMDDNGNQIWTAEYQPYGQAKVIGSFKLNLRAACQYQDDETDLYYNGLRYYDPAIGRYISSNSRGLAAGMNTYSYVNSNPLNYVSPDGVSIVAVNKIGLQLNTMDYAILAKNVNTAKDKSTLPTYGEIDYGFSKFSAQEFLHCVQNLPSVYWQVDKCLLIHSR